MDPITIDIKLLQIITQGNRPYMSLVFDQGFAMLVLPTQIEGLALGTTYRLTLSEVP